MFIINFTSLSTTKSSGMESIDKTQIVDGLLINLKTLM